MLGCLFGINQLFVILAMICLRKQIGKYSPMVFAVLASATVGAIIGLLIGITTPSGLEIHYSGSDLGGISCSLGKSVPYERPFYLRLRHYYQMYSRFGYRANIRVNIWCCRFDIVRNKWFA